MSCSTVLARIDPRHVACEGFQDTDLCISENITSHKEFHMMFRELEKFIWTGITLLSTMEFDSHVSVPIITWG